MGSLEQNTTLIYGIHIRESANDGSDFSNGATDYRVLFLGEDGLLHVKDSAGTVSDPYTGGGGSPNYTSATVTGGNKTLNSTSITEIDSALRLTLAAASGDLIEYGWSGLIETNANPVTFDAYTHDGSNNRVNPFGAGLSASAGSTLGVPGWYGNTSSTDEHQPRGVPVHRTLVSGDIQSGNVTVGFWYVKNNTNARTLFASTNIPLKVWMRNLGQ